jgi:hypothetical protein
MDSRAIPRRRCPIPSSEIVVGTTMVGITNPCARYCAKKARSKLHPLDSFRQEIPDGVLYVTISCYRIHYLLTVLHEKPFRPLVDKDFK